MGLETRVDVHCASSFQLEIRTIGPIMLLLKYPSHCPLSSYVKWNKLVYSRLFRMNYTTDHPIASLTAETIGAGTGCFLYLLRSTESWSGVGKVWASWECSINQIMYLGNILLLYIVPLSKIRISTSFCTWEYSSSLYSPPFKNKDIY